MEVKTKMKRYSLLLMFAVFAVFAMVLAALPKTAPPGHPESISMIDHSFMTIDNGRAVFDIVAGAPALDLADITNPTNPMLYNQRPIDFDAQLNGVIPAIVIRA